MPKLLALALVLFAMLAGAAEAGAESWFVVPVSSANGDGTSAAPANFLGAAGDGSAVYFVTSDPLLPEDADGAPDVYVRRGAELELVSVPAEGAPDSGSGQIAARKVSADGSTVVFQTDDSLSPDDTDEGMIDLYERSGGVTRMVSALAPGYDPGFEFPFYGAFVDVSPNGRFVAFSTTASLGPDDGDGSQDVYVYDRDSGQATLASPGGSGDVSLLRAGGTGPGSERVFMQTNANLLPALDSDGAADIYAFDTATRKLTLETPGTAATPVFSDISADGSHLFFRTGEQLVSDDSDGGRLDIYQRANKTTTLVSASADVAPDDFDAGFQKSSADGSVVYFTTSEALDPAVDTDGGTDDIYKRTSDGTVTLVSQGPAETLTFYSAIFSGITPDGAHAFFYTSQDLTSDDNDGGTNDAYERFGDTTTRISIADDGSDAFEDNAFAGFSADASRLFFQSDGQMAPGDADSRYDFYSRGDGHTSLVSPALEPCALAPSPRCEPEWHGVSADGRRVWLQSDEKLDMGDTDGGATDVFESRLAIPGTVSVASAPLAYTQGDPATAIDPALGVSDPYDDVFGATVRVAGGLQPGDQLVFGGVEHGDTFTLTGRGSDADYRAALRGVSFKATTAGTRTIELTVDNGAGPGAPAVRTIDVEPPATEPGPGGGGEPPAETPPITNPGPVPLPLPPRLRIEDTGAWVAHLRPRRIFRVPGLVFHCPRAAASACTVNVAVAGAGTKTLHVRAGGSSGVLTRLGHMPARRLASQRRLTLVAHASISHAGSETVRAVKRFRLLPERR
jgi:Tol biopolymer transport system component